MKTKAFLRHSLTSSKLVSLYLPIFLFNPSLAFVIGVDSVYVTDLGIPMISNSVSGKKKKKKMIATIAARSFSVGGAYSFFPANHSDNAVVYLAAST